MHDRAVRPGAGDGRERDVLQRAGVAAEALQRLDGVDFGELCRSAPRGRARRGSAPAPAPSRACAVRVPSISVAFFTAFSSAIGSRPAHRLAAGGGDRCALSASAAVAGSMPHRGLGLAPSRFERDAEIVRLAHIGVLLEAIAHAVRELAAVDEDGRPAVLRHQRVGERQRRVRDVGAADVERPGDVVRIGHHQRVGAQFGDLVADARELAASASPANFRSCTTTWPSGGAGRSCQIASTGLPSTATSSAPALAQAAWRAAPLPPRVQPRIVSRGGRRLQFLRQPGLRRRLDQVTRP